jgi:hypothetical protein
MYSPTVQEMQCKGTKGSFLMGADLRKRAFARAAEILGGREKLATYLKTDLEQLQRWSRLAKPPSIEVLQSLAEVLRCELLKNYRLRTSLSSSKRAKRGNK